MAKVFMALYRRTFTVNLFETLSVIMLLKLCFVNVQFFKLINIKAFILLLK